MKRRHLLWLILGISLLCMAGWFIFFPNEPTYKGRVISSWLEEYYNLTSGRFSMTRSDAEPLDPIAQMNATRDCQDAIRQIGTNALPVLLRLTAAKDTPLKTKINALLNKQRFISFRLKSAREPHRISMTGFQMLGADAKPAVPALIQLLSHPNSEVRKHAAFNLGSIGAGAGDAVPQLIQNLSDSTTHFYSLQALSSIHQKPDLVVPIFIETLSKPTTDNTVHDVAIMGLGKLGTNGKPGFFKIIPFLTNNVSYLRDDSSNALKQIDPIAAAKLGIQ